MLDSVGSATGEGRVMGLNERITQAYERCARHWPEAVALLREMEERDRYSSDPIVTLNDVQTAEVALSGAEMALELAGEGRFQSARACAVTAADCEAEL